MFGLHRSLTLFLLFHSILTERLKSVTLPNPKDEACWSLLRYQTDHSNMSTELRLIAGPPGSGVETVLSVLPQLTGYHCSSVYRWTDAVDTNNEYRSMFCHMTHYPFYESFGPIDYYINRHPTSVAIIYRHLAHALLTDFYRPQTGVEAIDDSLLAWLKRKDKALSNAPKQDYIETYIKSWMAFYRYWLTEYAGHVQVFIYSESQPAFDLDWSLLLTIFGFDFQKDTRRTRLNCFHYLMAKRVVLPVDYFVNQIAALDGDSQRLIREYNRVASKDYLHKFKHLLRRRNRKRKRL